MVLSRNQFFLLLLFLVIAPFYVYKIDWLFTSKSATGVGLFVGHTLELNGSISEHLVVAYPTDKDSGVFNAGTNLGFTVGDRIPVCYQKDNPAEVRIDVPAAIWGDTLVDSLLPILILLVLFLTPDRFDPLIPWNARIRIGVKPFIKIISGKSAANAVSKNVYNSLS